MGASASRGGRARRLTFALHRWWLKVAGHAPGVAFRWLDIAVCEKASGLILLRAHPRLDRIRNDPRYAPLVKRVGRADRVA